MSRHGRITTKFSGSVANIVIAISGILLPVVHGACHQSFTIDREDFAVIPSNGRLRVRHDLVYYCIYIKTAYKTCYRFDQANALVQYSLDEVFHVCKVLWRLARWTISNEEND